MITREHAYYLRSIIERESASLSDTDALTAPELFPLWKIKQYEVGDRVRFNDALYKCLIAHTAQETWKPDVSPSLWVRVDDPSIEWPDWVQPSGSTDAYAKGAKVSHNDRHWISDVDSNVWEPGVAMWTEAS